MNNDLSDRLLWNSSGGLGEEVSSLNGRGMSPARGSTSPGYDPEKPNSRKRTNTVSSGSGEKRTANKICRVCGDKAFSYNFNVITCESCKAFFRRNANKEKEIRCPFNEQCEINVVSRRFCQRCRLAKCFDVGMKKEWIMSDEARLEKKQRVEENRERRLQDALQRNSENRDSMSPSRDPSRDYVKTEDNSNGIANFNDFLPRQEDNLFINNRLDDNSASANVAMPNMEEASLNEHTLMEGIQTTSAHSLADVSSTTSNVHSMDVDPSTTMSSSGFIPPNIDGKGILPIVSVTNAVETSLMAQAQLAVAQVQVQAAINHQQQQIAAAVVAQQVAAQQVAAQQVAAQIAGAPPPPNTVSTVLPPVNNPLTQSLPPAIPPPIPAPILPQTMAPLAPPPAPILQPLNPLGPTQDMVTIPREVLVKLIENNTLRAASCSCTCVCGRYPSGSNIVDEVTKDLLSAGNSSTNANNCNSCDTKEEAKLETAEDFQRNGLLPSEDSSVQWLNCSQPTVVDPSVMNEAQPDNFSATQNIFDQQSTDSETALLSMADREILREVDDSNRIWREMTRGDFQTKRDIFGSCPSDLECALRALIRSLSTITLFANLNLYDRIVIVKNRFLPYLIVRCVHSVSANDLHWKEIQKIPQAMQAHQTCLRAYGSLLDSVRGNETIICIASLILLFDSTSPLRDVNSITNISTTLTQLLKRLLFSQCHQDASRARAEFAGILAVLGAARDVAHVAGSFDGAKFDSRFIEALLLEYS